MQLVLHFYVLLASFGLLLQVQSQDLQPVSRISSPDGESTSVNGSSAAGHCSNSVPIAGNTICREPTSSVLLDGNIPTLTGLDGDMWASQLLTLQKSSQSFTEINFEITPPSGFFIVRRVEVVLFNCPEWGIAVESLNLLGSISTSDGRDTIRSTRPSATSCHSLVRLCLQGPSTLPILTLQFSLPPGSTWVHVAEVTFYDDDDTCPAETTVNTPPPTTPEVTTAPITTTGAPMTTTSAITLTTVSSTTQDAMTTAPETSQTPTDADTTPDMTTAETTLPITTSMATEPTSSTTTSAEPESPLTSDRFDSTFPPAPGTPSTSDPESHLTTSGLIRREACSTSIILACVITAIATALLAIIIFALVMIAVCKCHPKFTPDKGSKTGPIDTWTHEEETKQAP